MEISKAIEILKEFNDYRRSEGKFANEEKTIRNLQYSAKEIGEAIDFAIDSMLVQKNYYYYFKGVRNEKIHG